MLIYYPPDPVMIAISVGFVVICPSMLLFEFLVLRWVKWARRQGKTTFSFLGLELDLATAGIVAVIVFTGVLVLLYTFLHVLPVYHDYHASSTKSGTSTGTVEEQQTVPSEGQPSSPPCLD